MFATYISTYDSAGGLTVDNTQQTVPMNADAFIDTAGYTRAGGVITVLVAGVYRIDAWCTVKVDSTAGGQRGGPTMVVQQNGADMAGFTARGYTRENGADLATNITASQIVNVSANDTFQMTITDIVGNEPVQSTLANASGIIISRLR